VIAGIRAPASLACVGDAMGPLAFPRPSFRRSSVSDLAISSPTEIRLRSVVARLLGGSPNLTGTLAEGWRGTGLLKRRGT
jgi:hypothetical protein